MSRACAFCGDVGNLTNEHVIPQWLGELLPHRNVEVSHIPDTFVVQKRGVHENLAAAKVRQVCARCNNGWMSQLEAEAKPVIGPMAHGRSITLNAAAQKIAATWLLKTCLTSLLSAGAPEKDEPLFREFHERRQPWGPHAIGIGTYDDERGFGSLIHRQGLVVIVGKDDREERIEGHVTTIMIGRLVGQINYLPINYAVANQFLQFIWPIRQEVHWPQLLTLNYAQLEELSKSTLPTLDEGNPRAELSWDELLS